MLTPLARAGLVIGLGIGGFFDGIVLHQILQWHHLVCYSPDCKPNSVAMLQRQNTQDGYFHLAVWILTIIGTILLFRAARQPDMPWTAQAFGGSVLAGWGTFNFVEGLIDHQILGIHHVLPGPHQFAADMAFLASGLLLIAGGWLLTASKPEPPGRQAVSAATAA